MQPKIAVGQRDFVIEGKKKKELWIEKLGAMQTLTPTGWDVKRVKESKMVQQRWIDPLIQPEIFLFVCFPFIPFPPPPYAGKQN